MSLIYLKNHTDNNTINNLIIIWITKQKQKGKKKVASQPPSYTGPSPPEHPHISLIPCHSPCCDRAGRDYDKHLHVGVWPRFLWVGRGEMIALCGGLVLFSCSSSAPLSLCLAPSRHLAHSWIMTAFSWVWMCFEHFQQHAHVYVLLMCKLKIVLDDTAPGLLSLTKT